MLPVVAIVGRPNTGKSTLFNRFVGSRYAIESDVPGTTRDRIYQRVSIRDFDVMLVDTGGLDTISAGDIEADVQVQSSIAISEADVILFVIDVRQELTSDDFAAADLLRKTSKPVFLVANKCDHINVEDKAFNLYELGFGEPLKVSAVQGIGVEHVEARVSDKLEELGYKKRSDEEVKLDHRVHVGFFGKPNVGKSSLVNAFFDEKRVIVSDIPGTTRDTTDTFVSYGGRTLNLIDTAGLRRRGKIEKGLEKYSVFRSLRAIERCDTALLILDFDEGVSKQDQSVSQFILESGKGLIIVVNKSDLMERGEESRDKYISLLRRKFAYVPWAPVVFVSAKDKKNIHAILDLVLKIDGERKKRLTTSEFNIFIEKLKYQQIPTGPTRMKPKIYYASQVGISPPHFVFFVNNKDSFHFSYRRFLENRIREEYGFGGTAVRIVFKNRSRRE